ncbi:hypothetical protein [Marinobacter similis]|uniref:Uncharacterized protein n=1 Tax=Marinobacter similis TaxID=1420916 RepID=W5YMQ8_9GAMM|nr:hypothetical protein [Marinobacter similis]AHI27778.1 hypothetical protein AU14_01245 [Marinobacter similis]
MIEVGSWTATVGRLVGSLVAVFFGLTAQASLASAPGQSAEVQGISLNLNLNVEGLSASIGEDNPRVLYILPWQAPTLPRRPREKLQDQFPALTQPVDPVIFEGHRLFRETLNPSLLSPKEGSVLTTQ